MGGKSADAESGGASGGWTRLPDGWFGKGPLPDGGWRLVRPPSYGESQDEVLIKYWPLLTADLLQLYGVDVADRALMQARPWSWFQALVDGCLTARSRLLWERAGAEGREAVLKALGQGADVTPWL